MMTCLFHRPSTGISAISAVLCGVMNTGSCVAGSAVSLNFTTTIEAPTCTMTVPTVLNLNAQQPGGLVLPDAVVAGTVADTVRITFRGCAEGTFSRTPSITVTGRTVALGGSEVYFADAPTSTTPAVGYGVKLSVSGDANFNDMTNIATETGRNGGGTLTAKRGRSLSSLNGATLTLRAQLSCGAYSPCSDNPAHHAGQFKASITFQLAYD